MPPNKKEQRMYLTDPITVWTTTWLKAGERVMGAYASKKAAQAQFRKMLDHGSTPVKRLDRQYLVRK